ncbi:MAG TPA: VCBS repeat-containing protein [Polyangiaceae bacterium]|nr:VCBS repeat-containing protein [Polyangiaceae bacterium]
MRMAMTNGLPSILGRRSSVLAAVVALGAWSVPGLAEAQVFADQGNSKLGTQPCGGAGCWTNYARVTDYDGDGDLDLVAVNSQGFFAPPSSAQPLVFYKNDGAGNFTLSSADFGNFSGAVRQVAFGDFDGDGDLDVYVPAAAAYQPDAIFIKGPSGFTDEAASRLPAGASSDAGFARAGDFDDDGDLDLLVGDGYSNSGAVPAHLYLNDGTGKFTEAASGTIPTAKNGGVNPDDVDLTDVDGDFDVDIYINLHNGQNLLWKNDGTGKFTDASSGLASLNVSANHYGPVLCDIDGDGDRDLMIDNVAAGYEEQVLVNDGTGLFTDETTERVSGNSGEDDNLVVCADYDGDGDFDMIIGALSSQERLFQNDGTGHFTFVANGFDGTNDPTLWMELGDLNGDGRLDAFTAQGESSPSTERVYFGTASVAVDVLPPKIIAVEEVTLEQGAIIHFAVSDSAVTDEGPRLKRAYLKLGTQEVPATFMGGDLYRAVVPATSETNYQVCAVDLEGNEACKAAGTTTTTTGSGGGGQGGSGQGGAQISDTAAVGTGGGGGSGDGGGSSDGCGCSVPGEDRSATYGVWAVALAGLGAVARRSRKGRR